MINSYTSWQPLEEVIVGRAYSPDYFDFIDNPQVRNQLQQILSETEEDLNNLQRTIEQHPRPWSHFFHPFLLHGHVAFHV